VLPLEFPAGVTRRTLGLDGSEVLDIRGLEGDLVPGAMLECEITSLEGRKRALELLCRLDTAREVDYYRHGGLLHYVLRERLASQQRSAA
jgi:aconitate hydratase